jgi:hypothetical protein
MEKIREYPKYLYHYTTLETLALILKHRTIRFNKLTKTDDLEEAMTGDLSNLGRFLFVSCWTDSEQESIPLWHIYSKNLCGVRIKLPFIPFKDYMPEYFNDPRFNREGVDKPEDIKFKLYLPIELSFNDSTLFTAFFDKNSEQQNLFKVEYTDDPDLLLPNVFTQNEEGVSIDFGTVGKFKRSCWDFQNEWRYRIQAIPLSTIKFQNPNIAKQELSDCINKIMNGYEIPIDYIDLTIDDKSFYQMEITKGPGFSESQSILLDAIAQKYNPQATIIESVLRGKIISK